MLRSTYTENKKHITNCHVRFFWFLQPQKNILVKHNHCFGRTMDKKNSQPTGKKKPKSEIAKLQVAVTKPSKFELGDLA